jgi:hypothetical protein
MSIRFSGQNEVEALNEAIAVGDIITVKLRNHFGQDSKNRFVCEVTEILPRTNDSDHTTARVRFRETHCPTM